MVEGLELSWQEEHDGGNLGNHIRLHSALIYAPALPLPQPLASWGERGKRKESEMREIGDREGEKVKEEGEKGE